MLKKSILAAVTLAAIATMGVTGAEAHGRRHHWKNNFVTFTYNNDYCWKQVQVFNGYYWVWKTIYVCNSSY